MEQEGQQGVPRGAVVEITVDGKTEPVPDKLTAEQLAALGMDWAGTVPAAEAAPEPPAPQPAPPAARPVREHHEECDGH
ncbi:hypothetical protein [Streptomyces sp. NPDC050255]|uniref:hypothetical protein n=1 Tax=Streptomyces sp. NPDC050255 TaxID=3365606 RepID=UPI0037AB5A55